jgi:hypothetical protein
MSLLAFSFLFFVFGTTVRIRVGKKKISINYMYTTLGEQPTASTEKDLHQPSLILIWLRWLATYANALHAYREAAIWGIFFQHIIMESFSYSRNSVCLCARASVHTHIIMRSDARQQSSCQKRTIIESMRLHELVTKSMHAFIEEM